MNDAIKDFRSIVDPIYKKMDDFLEEVDKNIPNTSILGWVTLSSDDHGSVFLFLKKHEGKMALFCRIAEKMHNMEPEFIHMNDVSAFIYFNILQEWDRIQTTFELNLKDNIEDHLSL